MSATMSAFDVDSDAGMPVVAPETSADLDNASNREARPAIWERAGIWVLLAGTAVLYLVGLSQNGWANSYYSAAVQAGSQSWTAAFFGSSDAASSITVDKPPLSLWVMDLSVRIFGLNSWSILVPEALMGVASVGLLYLAIRRWYGAAAGLFAGAMLAVTPVATLMFRFNNPDALLVLLLVAAAYATVRALEKASPAWLALAGALVGLGFMTKMLQALLVLPALVITYFIAAPTGIVKRIRDLLIAFAVMIVAGGWWVAIVELMPESSRPYIGGSQTNSVLELILGYNGLGRITGNEVGSVGGGAGTTGAAGIAGAAGGGPGGGGPGGGPGFGGGTGIGRLFDGAWAGGIAWFLPAATIMLVAVIWFTRSAARTDRIRAGALLWGLWALVTWAIFSFSSGIIHEYYGIALAPALAALVAIGVCVLWSRKASAAARITLAGALISAGVTATWIMALAGGWYAWVGLCVGAVVALAAVVVGSSFALERKIGRSALTIAAVALLIGPLIFSVATAVGAKSGSLPSVAPALAGSSSAPGGMGGPDGAGAGGAGGMSGLLDAPSVSSTLVATLNANAGDYTWVAAGIGSQTTAGYQLASGYSVMPIGGFNGTDDSPTLAQFRQYVADGDIHYFIGGNGFGPGQSGSSASSEISAWVKANFASVTVDSVVLYDLTSPVGDSGTVTTASEGGSG